MSRDPCLNLRDPRKGSIPTDLELRRHQTVFRIGCIILSKGTISRIACRFKITLKGLNHLVTLRRFISTGLDCGCDDAGLERLENRRLNGPVG
jgi:hypothetical protein